MWISITNSSVKLATLCDLIKCHKQHFCFVKLLEESEDGAEEEKSCLSEIEMIIQMGRAGGMLRAGLNVFGAIWERGLLGLNVMLKNDQY